MEKSLLDILEAERNLVNRINNYSKLIKSTSDARIKLLMERDDITYPDSYLVDMQNDIDSLNAFKFTCQEELAEIRRELKYYYRRHILD